MAANMQTHNDIKVDIEDDKLIATVSCEDKRLSNFIVFVANRWGHFKIRSDKGQVPRALEGTYTSMPEAIDKIRVFLASQKATPHKRVKDNWESKHGADA